MVFCILVIYFRTKHKVRLTVGRSGQRERTVVVIVFVLHFVDYRQIVGGTNVSRFGNLHLVGVQRVILPVKCDLDINKNRLIYLKKRLKFNELADGKHLNGLHCALRIGHLLFDSTSSYCSFRSNWIIGGN